jgi:uncharacterized protein (TIGR02646 family)
VRSVTKGPAPRNVRPSTQTAQSLKTAAIRFAIALPEANSAQDFARSEFDSLDKRTLRKALAEEQRESCIFCEARINPARSRIDHWEPVSSRPDLALDWRNLHLSCDAAATCDTAKGESTLGLPWPSACPLESWVGFTSDGEIIARSGPHVDALAAALGPSVLNLNHPTLREARRAALNGLREAIALRFTSRTVTKAQRERWATDDLAADPRPPFVSVRAAWLRGDLGR